MSVLHFLFALFCLLEAVLGYVHVEVFFAELCALVLLGLHVGWAVVLFYLGLFCVVEGLGVTDEVYHSDLLMNSEIL